MDLNLIFVRCLERSIHRHDGTMTKVGWIRRRSLCLKKRYLRSFFDSTKIINLNALAESNQEKWEDDFSDNSDQILYFNVKNNVFKYHLRQLVTLIIKNFGPFIASIRFVWNSRWDDRIL